MMTNDEWRSFGAGLAMGLWLALMTFLAGVGVGLYSEKSDQLDRLVESCSKKH
jgi:hypothetical protein